jgi:hypothetical protein
MAAREKAEPGEWVSEGAGRYGAALELTPEKIGDVFEQEGTEMKYVNIKNPLWSIIHAKKTSVSQS